VQGAQIFVYNPCFFNFPKHLFVLIPTFKPSGKILCNYHEIRVSPKKALLLFEKNNVKSDSGIEIDRG